MFTSAWVSDPSCILYLLTANLVTLLLENGATALIKNRKNHDALRYAHNDKIAELINTAIAKEAEDKMVHILNVDKICISEVFMYLQYIYLRGLFFINVNGNFLCFFHWLQHCNTSALWFVGRYNIVIEWNSALVKIEYWCLF